MEKIEKYVSSGIVRIFVYTIFLAGVYFATLKNFPQVQAMAIKSAEEIVGIKIRQDSMEKGIERIDKRTEEIYRILIRSR